MNAETGQSSRPSIFWMYAAIGIEAEVDPGTGQITLTRMASAADAGKAINPLACIQQIDGAAIMGLGMAMMEEVVFDGGRTLNPTFLDYKMPTTLDVPDTDVIIVESGHDEGPYGAKGIGESAIAPVPAALGNAVYDAVGCAGEGSSDPRREGLPRAAGQGKRGRAGMILRPFQYVESKTVDDAVAALRNGGEDARVIAGGTALVPLMKHSVLRPSLLVSIARVPGLAEIAPAASGGLCIGGVATHWAVSHSIAVQQRSPLLAYACARVASPTIRSMGTLGGNLCYGESASDPSPALLALRASVRLHGPGGERTVPITEFFTGFYETTLR